MTRDTKTWNLASAAPVFGSLGHGGTAVHITGPARSPKPIVISADGREIYVLHEDGRVDADWHEIVKLKDKFLAGAYTSSDFHVFIAAAIWFAKNT